MKLSEVEGARAPVPHSWRRHCSTLPPVYYLTSYTYY